MLTLQFGNNLLAETNNYQLVIEDEADWPDCPNRFVLQHPMLPTSRSSRQMAIHPAQTQLDPFPSVC